MLTLKGWMALGFNGIAPERNEMNDGYAQRGGVEFVCMFGLDELYAAELHDVVAHSKRRLVS